MIKQKAARVAQPVRAQNQQKAKKTIVARQSADQERLLDELRETPIVSAACARSMVAKATYYRWRRDDEVFASAADVAIQAGVASVNDMAVESVVDLIREGNWPALRFWLTTRHPDFKPRVDLATRKWELQLEEERKRQEKIAREIEKNEESWLLDDKRWEGFVNFREKKKAEAKAEAEKKAKADGGRWVETVSHAFGVEKKWVPYSPDTSPSETGGTSPLPSTEEEAANKKENNSETQKSADEVQNQISNQVTAQKPATQPPIKTPPRQDPPRVFTF